MRRTGRRRGPPRGLAGIAELIDKVYPSHEPEDVVLVRALAWWDRHVPPRIVRSARPARIHRGMLVVHTVSSAWSQELTLLMPRYAGALGRAVRGVDPRRIRVQVGPLPPRPKLDAARPAPIPPLAIGDLPDAVARALATIADDRVRDAVSGAAAQSLAPRSGRRR